MAKESYVLNEAQKDELTELILKTKETKVPELYKIYDEIVETLKRGLISGNDAYQARYIRDAIAVDEKAKEKFTEITDFLEKTFF